MNKRKKWTPKEEITESVLKFREKRKWQLALRRYILERNPCIFYAPYFGLSINDFRTWIEVQFTQELNWENFGHTWQFDHILPIAYFDFDKQEDLKLCWSFINIRVDFIDPDLSKSHKIDLLSAKSHFELLYNSTNLTICKQMMDKIASIQTISKSSIDNIKGFIIEYKDAIENQMHLNSAQFASLNEGVALKDILLEQKILKKFG
jgi:hypothetical protein